MWNEENRQSCRVRENAENHRQGRLPVRRQSDGLLRARYVASDQVQRETLEADLIRGAATCFACQRLPDASIPPILRNSQRSYANTAAPNRADHPFR